MTPENAAIQFIENIGVSKERASELTESLLILLNAQRAQAAEDAATKIWRRIIPLFQNIIGTIQHYTDPTSPDLWRPQR